MKFRKSEIVIKSEKGLMTIFLKIFSISAKAENLCLISYGYDNTFSVSVPANLTAESISNESAAMQNVIDTYTRKSPAFAGLFQQMKQGDIVSDIIPLE